MTFEEQQEEYKRELTKDSYDEKSVKSAFDRIQARLDNEERQQREIWRRLKGSANTDKDKQMLQSFLQAGEVKRQALIMAVSEVYASAGTINVNPTFEEVISEKTSLSYKSAKRLRKGIGHFLLLPCYIICLPVGFIWAAFTKHNLLDEVDRKTGKTDYTGLILLSVIVLCVAAYLKIRGLEGITVSILIVAVSLLGQYLVSERDKDESWLSKLDLPIIVILFVAAFLVGAYSLLISGNKELQGGSINKNSNHSMVSTTPVLPPRPTPDTGTELAKQGLREQIVSKYFPQCNGNIYALQKGNKYQMYELKHIEIFLDVLNKTTAADIANGKKTVYGGNITFLAIQGQDKPVYRVSNEASLEELAFKEQSYEDGTPFSGYVNVETVNGTWALRNGSFVPLSCGVVTNAIQAEARNKQLETLNQQLLDSFNTTAKSTANALFTRCDGQFYIKELWENDFDNTKGYILHQAVSLEPIPVEDQHLSDAELAIIAIRLNGHIRHQPPGDGLQGRTSEDKVLITFKRQGTGWRLSDPLIKKVTCPEVAQIQTELYRN